MKADDTLGKGQEGCQTGQTGWRIKVGVRCLRGVFTWGVYVQLNEVSTLDELALPRGQSVAVPGSLRVSSPVLGFGERERER